MRPRPGTKQDVVNAKMALFSALLDECKFKTETKWGLEQLVCLGTGIWKWGIDFREVTVTKRKATTATIKAGSAAEIQESLTVPLDRLPEIT